MWSVYFLRDPRTMRIRYIGISKHPRHRLGEHWTSRLYQYTHERKREWLVELDSLGLKPKLDVILSGLTKKQAERVEYRLIKKHLAYGNDLAQGKAQIFDGLEKFISLWAKCSKQDKASILDYLSQESFSGCRIAKIG
jgi:hypothetical protein